MKKNITLKTVLMATLLMLSINSLHSYAADFTAGNLVVVRLGDGTAALSNASTAIFLDEYSTTGTLVQSITIPTSGDNMITNSGSAGSEGAISLSPDGRYLAIAGYNIAPGTASVNGTASATINRKILRIDKTGGLVSLLSSTAYSANNIRSAVTNGTDYWAGGTGSTAGTNGVQYFGTGTAGQVSSTVTNVRVVSIQNGQLYFSTGSGTVGIYKVGTGLPTGTGETSTIAVNTTNGASTSPYAFAFNSANTICYVADDRAVASNGGIQKWTSIDGITWTLAYTLSANGSGARGLVVDWSGSNPVIYATNSATLTQILSITDTGSASTATVLATSATNTAIRGIAFAPFLNPIISNAKTSLLNNWTLSNNTLTFNLVPSTKVEVYSLTGSKVALFDAAQQIELNLSKGIYILKVDNKASKIILN